jgi:hypothetical protein
VQLQLRAQLRTGKAPSSEFGEQAEFDGREEDFGMPEAKSGLQDG